MSGKPAARKGDRVGWGVIVTGSATVLIGSQGGLACSVCPGGVKVSNPVNPQLGAKVLVGDSDLDFALPGALPVAWQRQYSSYVNAEHGARCSVLGWGWHLPWELALELDDQACRLFDAAGRIITFEALAPGDSLYSPSEDIWLVRGGPDAAWRGEWRWRHIPAELANNPDCVLAASGQGSTIWLFGVNATPIGDAAAESAAASPAAGASQANTEPTATEPVRRWHLQAQLDRFGRRQRYAYADSRGATAAGNPKKPLAEPDVPAGHLLTLTDGVGRRYRLHYERIHTGRPAEGLWGADDGWRLVAVELESDPVGIGPLPQLLVRYGYDRDGQLVSVHNRAGERVREFAWQHRRLVAHRHRGGPRHTYQYESAQPGARVIQHGNEQGLDYRFEYLPQPVSADGQPRRLTRVTDSLGRIETYHFEGQAGLERLVVHERADGSQMRYEYDSAARLVATTDPLGRTTRLLLDAQGQLLSAQGPDRRRARRQLDTITGQLLQSQDASGAVTRYGYDDFGRLTEVTLPDRGTERYTYPSPQEAPLSCDSPSTIEDARGGTKHLRFSDAGLLVAYTDCSGSSTHYQYDRFGELLQVTNALGQRQRLERDAAGQVVAAIHPDGSREQYQHNSAGQIVHIALHGPQGSDTAGAGSAKAASHIDLTYDLWGRLISRVHGGLALQFEYDAAGRLSRLVNENGAQSRFAWDVMDRLVQEEGFDQRLQRYRWDAAGQLLEASDGNAAQQHCTRYRWDDAGQLSELTLPGHGTAEVPPDQITRQHFEWDAAGRLLAARALGAHDQLLSEALLARDTLGRITGETQRLYKASPAGDPPSQTPEIEFEHTIAHRLDALGNRQASQLQGVGQIEWLLYGSGHVHGLQHNGSALLDFERDALHRESGRTLAGSGGHTLTIRRRWDALGRLQALASQGLQGQAQVPQVLIGQLSQRQYHYDALGQLTAVQTPAETLRYGYDAAGRLRAMQGSLGQPQRWSVDPAGNRLPQPLAPGQAPEADWASQVHAHWKQQDFNLLGQAEGAASGTGAVTRWPDNRIGFTDTAAWRYDAQGNRVEQLRQDGQRQQLIYDGANRLIEVILHDGRRSRYRYDALGRRLAQTTEGASGAPMRYHGWDGDRLVHTEQVDATQPEQRHIAHTVYEPESFTPLVQLSATASAQAKPQVLALMAQSQDEDENGDDNAQMVAMLDALPQDMRQALEQSLRQAMQDGIPQSVKALMPDQGQNTLQRLTGLREQLEKQEQNQQTEITVRHYHCDHLGTPLALTDQNQQIVWAARLDPWGNVEQEFNPHDIEQSIRLPGQHHDKDSGLYYNRNRYYDPSIGAYINQDPIGWLGGINHYNYPLDASRQIDPLGLDPTRAPQRGPDVGKVKGWWDKAQNILNWKENVEKGKEVKQEQDTLMCKAEKEIADRIAKDQITPEAGKAALAAKKVSIYAAGPVSTAVEGTQDSLITNAGVAYGYSIAAPARDCSKLLSGTK